ncbi:MAG: hypothetical protein SGARI_006297, partial [Bacillariaceae sp.]
MILASLTAAAVSSSTVFASPASSQAAAAAGPAQKPLVRGQDPPSSHLLRNNPLRTSNTRSSGIGGQQPTRNVVSVDENEENAQVAFHRQSEAFLGWCYREFGIDSSLVTIEMFEYHDYIKAMEDRIDVFCEDCYGEDTSDEHGLVYDSTDMYDDDHIFDLEDEDRFLSVSDYPTIPVRGLAAKRDIDVGQVVLAIPHQALWTLSNVVDSDPVLTQVMGKEIREQMGWDTEMDEIPLLAVALLYQLQQVQQKKDTAA